MTVKLNKFLRLQRKLERYKYTKLRGVVDRGEEEKSSIYCPVISASFCREVPH